jgi:hypothetical protein
MSRGCKTLSSTCTKMVYIGALPKIKSARPARVRRSVTLSSTTAQKVSSLARRRDVSENRVLLELIEDGIEASRQKEKAFFELAGRFRAAKEPEEVKQLGDELGRFVFGE